MGRINVTVSIFAGASVPNMSLQLAAICCGAPARQACQPAQGKPGLLACALACAHVVSCRFVSCRFVSFRVVPCRCGVGSALLWSGLFCSGLFSSDVALLRVSFRFVSCCSAFVSRRSVLGRCLCLCVVLVCVVWVCVALRCLICFVAFVSAVCVSMCFVVLRFRCVCVSSCGSLVMSCLV